MNFFRVFLLGVGVLAALHFLAVVLINPRGAFRTQLVPAVTLDSRREKMALFQRFHREGAVDGLVLGSSRSMKLHPGELHMAFGGRFFNFAVENAHAEDYLAVYRWARQQGARPRVVIIGLDIEALHNNDQFENQLTRNVALMQQLEGKAAPQQDRLRGLLQFGRDVKAGFTTAYLMDMLYALRAARQRAQPPLMAFQSDGYLQYRRYEEEKKRGTFDLQGELELSLQEYRRRFKEMAQPSPLRRHYLQQAIAEIERDGATPVVWITNLHPYVSTRLPAESEYQRLLSDVRAVMREVGHASPRARLFDFSDPAHYGGDMTDWYDGAHIGERNARKLVQQLAAETRSNGF